MSALRVAIVALAVAGFLHFKGCVPIGPGLAFGVCTMPLPPPPEKENT
jgi:hypothetical protein